MNEETKEPQCDIYGTVDNFGCRVHKYVPCPTLDPILPAPETPPEADTEQPSSVNCVCGEEFTVERVERDEHIHCPICGSYYDSDLRFQISKSQVAVLQAHKSAWSTRR